MLHVLNPPYITQKQNWKTTPKSKQRTHDSETN